MLLEPIAFVDLASIGDSIKRDILAAIEEVLDSGNYILGKQVELFEEEFAAYCQTRYAVGVANGSEALHLTMRAYGIGPGDEVITAGNSFAASALAIAHAGATPVLVDVDPHDYNMDVDALEEAISPHTKAIIPVHLYGQPARMEAICEIAGRYGLRVIEDAAQAHGAALYGRRMGSWGDAGCFSFYPAKNLGGIGDGGAVVTDDAELARKLCCLRNYGQEVKNRHDCLGFNSRLDTIQAAALLVKLPYLSQWTAMRRQAAADYRLALDGVSDLILPLERAHVEHVYHLFVVRHPNRDALIEHLKRANISCGIHYPRALTEAEPFRHARTVPYQLPVCQTLVSQVVSLPMYPGISAESIGRVAEAIKTFAQRYSSV